MIWNRVTYICYNLRNGARYSSSSVLSLNNVLQPGKQTLTNRLLCPGDTCRRKNSFVQISLQKYTTLIRLFHHNFCSALTTLVFDCIDGIFLQKKKNLLSNKGFCFPPLSLAHYGVASLRTYSTDSITSKAKQSAVGDDDSIDTGGENPRRHTDILHWSPFLVAQSFALLLYREGKVHKRTNKIFPLRANSHPCTHTHLHEHITPTGCLPSGIDTEAHSSWSHCTVSTFVDIYVFASKCVRAQDQTWWKFSFSKWRPAKKCFHNFWLVIENVPSTS